MSEDEPLLKFTELHSGEFSRDEFPIIFVDPRGNPPPAAPGASTAEWLVWLKEFHRNQKLFLFMPDDPKAQAWLGTKLRDKTNVLYRILNYVLLFRSRDVEGEGEETKNLREWTAYDFFYYLRSLVPVEIQVRTKLIGTWADQNHALVYKQGVPPSETLMSVERMNEVGIDLSHDDQETDIDMGAFVTAWTEVKEDNEMGALNEEEMS